MHLNMSYQDIRNLPITYRRWFIRRLTKHFEQQRAAYDNVRGSGSPRSSDKSALTGEEVDMSKVTKFFKSKIKK